MSVARRSFRRACLVVFVIAIGARGLWIGKQSLWADEIFSLAMATGHSLEHPATEARPELGDYVERSAPLTADDTSAWLQHEAPPAGLSRVLRAVRLSDTSPPLYYVLLYGWTLLLGTRDAALHGFSVLCALACVPLLVHLARRIGGRRSAVPAALLFALAPTSICYSIEGRMYSLIWLLALLLLALTLRVHERGDALGFLGWLAAIAANLYTHYYSAFVVAACGLWLLVLPGRCRRWWLLPGAALVLAAVLPWYRLLPQSLSAWRVTEGWLDGLPEAGQLAQSPLWLTWTFFSNGGKWGGSGTADQLLLVTIALVAAWLVASRWRRVFSPARGLVLLWLAAAVAGPAVADLLRHTSSSLVPRYALAGMPAAFLLLGYGIGRLRPWLAWLACAAIVAAWVPGLLALYRIPSRDSEPYREVCATVNAMYTPEDLVLVHSIPSGLLGVARYLDPEVELASWVGQLKQRRVPEDVLALSAGRRRLVFIDVHAVGEPAPEKDWLDTHAVVEQEFALQAMRVVVYRPAEGQRFPAATTQGPAH